MVNRTLITVFLILSFSIIGCGGGNDPITPPSKTGNLSGTVYAPNGTDPVSNALVYVVDKSGTVTGPAPGENNLGYDYTNPMGVFSISEIPTGTQSLKIIKGAFTLEVDVQVAEGENKLSKAETTLPSDNGGGGTVEKMAVVTGNYDAIENVLAKIGLGDVDETGSLVLGTESFTIVDGNSTLDDEVYPNFDEWISVATNYSDYRTIFLNCGNSYEDDVLDNTATVSSLKKWVEEGGRLYATDWSYDIVEGLWPDMIDFFGMDEGLSTTPETRNEAQAGDVFDSTNATVFNVDMQNWLTGISATSEDGTVLIEGWLPAWAAIDAASESATVHVEAPVMVDGEETTRPVTITFDYMAGKVFYSSYHTESFLSTGLTPQDRILQYFVFEVL